MNKVPSTSLIIDSGERAGLFNLREFVAYRHLFYFLVMRDIKAVYRQTVLGIIWAVIGPVMSMIVLTFVFGTLAKMPSEGLPYPIFAFAALVPWSYFTNALSGGTNSLLQNSHIVTKVYFPRIILLLVSLCSGLVNFGISMVLLIGLMLYFGVAPTVNVVWLPLFLLLGMATALGLSMILAPLNAQFRDVAQGVPYLISLGLYVTPIAYPLRVVPEPFRTILELNPIAHVVQGFRWALLGIDTPPSMMLIPAVLLTLAVLVIGLVVFRFGERILADVI